ncbi:Voltage-gated Ion Channel (VIC) Superfamily [Phytophthora palmivora]|uniref:Voltage-gated Ion Channel (VIC) Superfamily n=1 Tax=Phytophthora palmivora TaxID=4796 RepID=A0A2P4YF36_9STRA|nr:Voltage-gated Ion Channel (VIC) Superfamily [Phytophthora palmivora]
MSVPLRIGFLFDPYATSDWSSGWTIDLTVFSILDVLADTAGFASLMDIFAAQRREQAAAAADTIGAIGARRQRSTRGPKLAERKSSLLTRMRDSMQVAWSLNTILPENHKHHGIRRPVLLEIASMLPLELLALAFGPNSLHLLRVLKLLRLHRVPGCMRELKHMYTGSPIFQMLEYTGNAVLFNTVMLGLVTCHWIACGYMAVAHLECGIDFMLCSKAYIVLTTIPGAGEHGTAEGITGVSPTGDGSGYTCWAIEDYLVGTNVGRQYSRAVYWASRTIVTAGFYDVAATTNLETLYVIFAQVVGAIVSTAVLATFLFIFRHRNARMQEFMAHVDNAKEYMRIRHFPEAVREGVLGYYKNAWAAHRALHHDEAIERLPGHLRVSVYSVLKAHRIQDVAFLAKESIEFINTLALRIEFCVYSPKDWIIEKLPDGMYFVLRGSVQLDGPSHPQPRFVKTGEHFAEGSLIFPGRSDERARAQTYCDLYKLPQRCFYKTLTIFFRESAPQHLEEMRSMHARHDQQEQKMKRMLGRSAGNDAGANPTPNSGRNSVVLGSDSRGVRPQRIPWRLPGSNFRKWWEQARLVSLVFVIFEVPLYCVFDADTFPFGTKSVYSFRSITSILVEMFFVVDVVFRARFFAYIDQVALITVNDPSYIFEAYRENGLWFDLLAIIPLPLVVEFIVRRGHGWTMWLHISRLIRLLRARYLQHTIQEFCHIRGLSSKMQQAGTMLLYVTVTLHVAGCLWFLMARFSVLEAEFEPILEEYTRDRCLRDAGLYGNCSWTLYDAYGQIGTTFKIQDPDHSIYTGSMAYVRSIYWAIVALTTVGYGDIVAFSTYESYFAAVWVFVGAIINYGVVGAMSSIISNLTASSRHHSEKMNTINVTLGHFRISESVRVRIRQFYHQQLYVQKVTSEVQLLDGLPQQLRHRISSILHAESVRKVPLFVDAQNERLLSELTGLFRRQLFQRGDPFFAEGTLCEEMYVVVNGRANIFSKRVGSVPVGALSAGDCFGVCELLLQKSFSTTVIAATVVDASVITYSAFTAKIERYFPAEMETLRLQATQQHIFDTLTLEAVIDNIKSRSTIVKFTDQCTSMFEEKENWGQQRIKMRLRLYWDLIVLVLDVYNAFQVTFRIGFLAHPSSGVRLVLMISDFVGDALLLIDIYLKLYYFECEGVGVINLISREERSTSYKEHELRGDILSSLPLYYVGSSFLAMSLCRLPRLFRLHQVPAMIDSLIMRLQQRFSAGGNISAYLSPIKLVLILLFTGHLAACIFYLICHTDHNPKNWTHHDPIVHMEHESVGVLYLRAFYWALTTLTLVGSREIVPLGIPGTIWATFTCLCCAFIVGHIVGELSELILEMDKTKKELKERESHFEQFAKDHDLPASIRTRVLHYLKFQHHYLKGMDIYDTFSDLSPNLRVQLMMDLHGDTLQNLCIAPYLNQTQINGLAVRLKSELYIPGDTIIVEGDLGHKLYIVKGGTGVVLWKSTGTAVATLTAGSLFGEVAFFLRGQRRIATVQATTCSELLVLGRRSWEELLASSPREEAECTERALVQWVQYCLKGYNIMTVEIVKDIKSGDNDGAARAHHRQRKLKRSQSLPLFDRHFAFMIREELQDSNAKESDSKLNLGFELLQRCRQPEFSSLFRVYLSWLKRKDRWRQWYDHQMQRFKWLNTFSSSRSSSDDGDPQRPRTVSVFQEIGHVSPSILLQPDGASSSTSTKAEDFVNLLSRCYRLWEWVVVLVGLFYAVTIPFFVCFASDMITFHEENEDTIELVQWECFVLCIDVICIADFLLKHSAFRRVLQLSAGDTTDIPTSKQSAPVAPPALSTMGMISLPLDLLLFFPPLSTSSISDHRWFYLSLFQLNKIPLILESIEASERLTQFLAVDLNLPISESRLHFIRTLGVYLLSGHWIACLWFRLGLHAYNIYGASWLSTYKMLPVDGFGILSEIPTSRRYLRSLHFAIGSITTIFYGDVVSMNVIETVVEIAFIVVCILIFGVLVGAQVEMIEANYKHKMLFEQNLMELYHFLKSNDVPRDVRHRLRLYYTNTWLKYHGHDDLEGVRGLSTLLVEDIAQYTLRDFANQVSILKSCDESFLRSLLTCLKHIICSPSEAVVRKGDVDRSMYFIARGKVLVQGPGFELVKHEGDFFGELSLLYGIPRSATCSSLGLSLLYVLEWETYERLLADYPEYREQNRREWVIVSTVLKTGESRFRSIIDIVARMEKANWVLVDEIIRKAKSLK